MKQLSILLLAGVLGASAPAWGADAKEPTLPTYVNINTADEATLAEVLDGVGLSKAKAIVAHRKTNGAFKTPEDLAAVKGIGDRLVELNIDKIRVKD
jgi:competence protein ComEA